MKFARPEKRALCFARRFSAMYGGSEKNCVTPEAVRPFSPSLKVNLEEGFNLQEFFSRFLSFGLGFGGKNGTVIPLIFLNEYDELDFKKVLKEIKTL